MFKLVHFEEWHTFKMLDQKCNIDVKELFLSGKGKSLESTNSFTGFLNGEPVVCGGILEIWQNRGQVWCIFNEECKYNFVPVFRGIRNFIRNSSFKRIEICVPFGFKKGMRRAEMLGFKLECAMAKKYLPDGSDCSIYSLVRD